MPSPLRTHGHLLRATVTPLASILGSGLLIIVPVLEITLGRFAVFGAIGVSAVAYVTGTAIRHNVKVVEPLAESHRLNTATVRLQQIADAVIVVAYVISVALYLRIMAEYIVGYLMGGDQLAIEKIIACVAVGIIVVIGVVHGFAGLDTIDRYTLIGVLVLTTVLGVSLVFADAKEVLGGSLHLPPPPSGDPLNALLVLGGIVITVQGFETVRYLGDEYDAPTRIRASRLAQLVAASIYIGFTAAATPVMGIGTSAGADRTLLDITARVAPFLALPLVLSAVFSQFSAAVADTAAAEGNLRRLVKPLRGRRAYIVSGVAAILLAATVPTNSIVAIASRAFAAYYALQAVVAFRTSKGISAKIGFGALALLMLAITIFALPAG